MRLLDVDDHGHGHGHEKSPIFPANPRLPTDLLFAPFPMDMGMSFAIILVRFVLTLALISF